MRTTMNLSDALLEAVRRRAEEENRTVTSLVEQALRDLLDRQPPSAEPLRLPTDGGTIKQILVNLDDKDALYAALDADGPK